MAIKRKAKWVSSRPLTGIIVALYSINSLATTSTTAMMTEVVEKNEEHSTLLGFFRPAYSRTRLALSSMRHK